MINPAASTVLDILNLPVQLLVPKYQREYTWGKDEAEEFFEDLKSHVLGSGVLFLGTLIFDVSEYENKKIKIVDGQQRITTILLLLIACRDFRKKQNEERLATLIQEMITFTDRVTGESRGCRLIASEGIRDILDIISKFEWSGEFPLKIGGRAIKRQVNKVKPVYDFFLSELEKNPEDLPKYLEALYKSYAVRIDIKNEMEAFSIFERTNGRGVDLEVSDLLKNYLFAQNADDFEESWKYIVENSEGTILRMLKYFYVARRGYISKTDLYKKIKSYSNEVGTESLIAELEEFSNYYKKMKLEDAEGIKDLFDSMECTAISCDQEKYTRIHLALQGLRLFKVVQIYPLINAAILCFIRLGNGNNSTQAKNMVRLFETLEKYHFINNAICKRIGNEVEKLYADSCLEFGKSTEFETTVKELIKKLREKLATEEEFQSKFIEISYSQNEIAMINYIFDRLNNFEKSPGSRIKIFNPDKKITRRNHSIEHFLPQKPKENLNIDNETMDAIDNIGNLLIINWRTNPKLGNLNPEEKIEKMKGIMLGEVENLTFVQDFIKTYGESVRGWNKTLIEKRAKDMAKKAYNIIWKIN